MEWQFQAADAGLALLARPNFLDVLHAACTPDSDCEGAGIVFSELVGNVIRHAPGPIDIALHSDMHGLVTLDVCDEGASFDLPQALPETLFSESGRGLCIVRHFCPSLSSSRSTGGNKVSVVLPVLAEG